MSSCFGLLHGPSTRALTHLSWSEEMGEALGTSSVLLPWCLCTTEGTLYSSLHCFRSSLNNCSSKRNMCGLLVPLLLTNQKKGGSKGRGEIFGGAPDRICHEGGGDPAPRSGISWAKIVALLYYMVEDGIKECML